MATCRCWAGASTSTRRCTSTRSAVRAACCWAPRSRWCGAPWPSCAARCAGAAGEWICAALVGPGGHGADDEPPVPLRPARPARYDPWLFRGGFFLVGLCTLACIAAATHRRSWIGRLLGIRPLHWVGTRSYGLYLCHWPIYQIIREPGEPLIAAASSSSRCSSPCRSPSSATASSNCRCGRVAWASSCAASAVPGRRRRVSVDGERWWSARPRRCFTGFATVQHRHRRSALRRPGRVRQPEGARGHRAGVSAARSTPTTVASTAPRSSHRPHSPWIRARPRRPPPWHPPPRCPTRSTSLPAYAIGESVMLGAAPQLQAGGVQVNAAVSRQGTNVAEVVGQLRAAAQLGRVVIVQTGTNGQRQRRDARQDHERPPRRPDTARGVPHRARTAWLDRRQQHPHPAVARSLPEREGARLGDALADRSPANWPATATTCAPAAAKQFYANLIFDAIGRPDLKK